MAKQVNDDAEPVLTPMEEVLADRERRGRRARVYDGCIVLNTGGPAAAPGAYKDLVDLDRCDTAEKILGWVLHLSEKNWVDGGVVAAVGNAGGRCQQRGDRSQHVSGPARGQQGRAHGRSLTCAAGVRGGAGQAADLVL